MSRTELIDQPSERGVAIALGTIAVLSLLSCCGCGATVTVNILSSHSRYGQAVGGTNTVIRGQIEGGGGNGTHASMSP